jgi:hypothetical protein
MTICTWLLYLKGAFGLIALFSTAQFADAVL